MHPLYADNGARTSPQEEIGHALKVLYRDGVVAELRAFGKRKTYAGWFDDLDELAKRAAELDANGFDCYVTLNPCKPALLGRADNEVIEVDPKRSPLTSDTDIEQRWWVMVDFDPDRPAKVSATDEEASAAWDRAEEGKAYLEARGFSGIVLASSGNGAHLLVRVDLPNDIESRELIEAFLKALSFKFSDDKVGVDEGTFNAARLTKPYGVMARKGSNVERIGRVHRCSKLVEAPQGTEPVGRELLRGIAEEKPEKQSRGFRVDPRQTGYEDFDLERWIERHGLRVKREGPWDNGGYRWILEECPWNGHTDDSAYVVRLASGAIAAGCHHNTCLGYGWRDLREHYEPDAYEWGHAEEETEEPPVAEPPTWPKLAEEALHGLAGEIVRTIEPHTEADVVAVLGNLVCWFGNAIGRGAFLRVGADVHHLNLYVALVGETAKGRKGMSRGHVRDLMHTADPEWADERVMNGLSSGEGLIYAVRDRVEGENKEGEEVVLDEGVSDKRLLVEEAELAGTLKVMSREGNTLSPLIRQAWDGGRLQVMTRTTP